MFKHFSSQDHVRTKKKKIFHESHKKLEGNFYEAFFSHNLRTQRTHTIKSIFFSVSSPFFSLPSFSKPERDGLCHKNSRMRNTQGKSSLFTIFFSLIFFLVIRNEKKKSATNVFVYSVFIKMYVVKHTRGMKMKMWKNKKIFPRLQLCIEKKKKIEMRENEKKKLKNVHRPQIAGYSW